MVTADSFKYKGRRDLRKTV